MVPYQTYRQSQMRAYQLHYARLNAESENGKLAQELHIKNQRLANIQTERSQLKNQVLGLINRSKNDLQNPLSKESTKQLQNLTRDFPEFEFDARTGVSKFDSDILFSSGSAQINSRGRQVLGKFAEILNRADTRNFNILVVGHTDDQRIAKGKTRSRHPTNWHLSTNRADSVILVLAKSGVKESRMGAAGYSKYQPVSTNTDAKSRQKNRRVEIYVLTPDAVVAGWDPVTSTSRN